MRGTFNIIFIAISLVVSTLADARLNGLCVLDWAEIRQNDRSDDAVQRRFYHLKTVTREQILTWLNETTKPGTTPRLVFHVENAALKTLKDKVIGNGVTAISLTSGYKQIFFRILEEHPEVMGKIAIVEDTTAEYADYKSIRILFREDTPALRKSVQKIYDEANREFAERLPLWVSEETLGKIQSAGGLPGNPRMWHLAGFGSSPEHGGDEAATAARVKRNFHAKTNDTTILDFNDPAVLKYLNGELDEAETRRAKIQTSFLKDFGTETKLLRRMDHWGGQFILAPRLIDLLRRVPAKSEAEYIQMVRARVANRFGTRLSDEQIRLLQKYFHAVDVFSPSMHLEEEVTDMGFQRAQHGLIAVDGVGLGPENMVETMERVFMAKRFKRRDKVDTSIVHDPARVAIDYARKGQNEASGRWAVKSEKFRDTVEARGVEGDLNFSKDGFIYSGDDAVFAPKKAMSLAEKMDFVAEFSRNVESGTARIGFGKTGEDIDLAHHLEKELKLSLESLTPPNQAAPDSVNRMMAGVDVISFRDGGGGLINLLIPGNHGAALKAKIKAHAEAILKRDSPKYQINDIFYEDHPAIRALREQDKALRSR